MKISQKWCTQYMENNQNNNELITSVFCIVQQFAILCIVLGQRETFTEPVHVNARILTLSVAHVHSGGRKRGENKRYCYVTGKA